MFKRHGVYIPDDLWEAANAEADRRNAEESHNGRVSVSSLVQQGLRLVLGKDRPGREAGPITKKPAGPPNTARRCRCGHWEVLADFAAAYPGMTEFPEGHRDLTDARDCFRCLEIRK